MTWNQFKCVTLKLFFLGSFFSIHWLNLYDLVIEQCNLWYYDSFLNSKPNKFIQTDFWTWNKIKKNVNFLCVKIMFKIYFDDDNKTHNLCRWITVLFLVFIFCFRLRLLPPMRTWLWDNVLCFVCFCFSCDFFFVKFFACDEFMQFFQIADIIHFIIMNTCPQWIIFLHKHTQRG